MNSILIVAGKEIRELISNRTALLINVAFVFFFSLMQSLALSRMDESLINMSLGRSIFFLSTVIAFFVAYTFTSQIFLREKMNHVIETLLCAPVSLMHIWAGKLLAITALAYVLAILTAVLVMVASGFMGSFVVPGVEIFVHVLVVIPFFVSAVAGLLGFTQYRLGMRESRILNFIIFIPAFGGLYSIGLSAGSDIVISWIYVFALLASSVIILALTCYLTSRLSKERIVTTLP